MPNLGQKLTPIAQYEYDFIKERVDQGTNAYQVYRELQATGSVRASSFVSRWVKRIKDGDTLEDVGRGYRPRRSEVSTKTSNDRPIISGTPARNLSQAEGLPTNTPTKNLYPISQSIRPAAETSILIAQSTADVISQLASYETEVKSLRTELHTANEEIKELRSECDRLQRVEHGNGRALEVLEELLEHLERTNPNVRKYMRASEIRTG